MSALPNSLIAAQDKYTVTVTGILEVKVIEYLVCRRFVSCVGHESTAKLFSERLDLSVSMNREQVDLNVGDTIIAGLFTPPRRLAEGILWTEEEILAMPINWVLVQKHVTECIQIVEGSNNYQPYLLV